MRRLVTPLGDRELNFFRRTTRAFVDTHVLMAFEVPMLCSNCGKEIPAADKVCPWCDTVPVAKEKTPVITTTISIVAATIGYWKWGKLGSFAAFFVGLFLGAAIEVALERRKPD